MSRRHEIQDATGILATYRALGTVVLVGFGAPTNSIVGFTKACLYLDLTNAHIYYNSGTNASSTWTQLDAGVALATLAATAAELNRNNQTSVRGVALAGSTSITTALHEGRDLFMTGTGSAFTQTLPAATGTFGRFYFWVGAVNTSNHVIQAAGADVFKGAINLLVDNSATSKGFVSTANQTITLNGTTKGGASISGPIELIDFAAGVWLVGGGVVASGTLATPFS